MKCLSITLHGFTPLCRINEYQHIFESVASSGGHTFKSVFSTRPDEYTLLNVLIFICTTQWCKTT
jgi:hypothetical protein